MTRRWVGSEDSQTRADILDATLRLIVEEGYTAVSSRRVAAKVGVNPALVHYYFGTMDDLLLAVFRRSGDAYLRRLKRAMESERPLRALWDLSTEAHGVAEFLALAERNDVIRAEIAVYAERTRTIEREALTAIFEQRGVDVGRYPPGAVTMLVESISQLLLTDNALGITTGHDELISFVEQFLGQLEPRSEGDAGAAT